MISSLLRDTWDFYKAHALLALWITLPIVIPVEIFAFIYNYFFVSAESAFIVEVFPAVIYLLSVPIYGAALVLYISFAIEGKPINVTSSWEKGLTFYIPYLAVMAMVLIAVMFGLILLVVPGIVIGVRYSFATFDLVLNGSTPIASLSNSWKHTKGHSWVIFLGAVIIMGAFYVPYFIFASLFDQGTFAFWVFSSASNIVLAAVGIIYTIFVFRIYWLVVTEHNKSLNTDTGDAGAG